MKRPTLLLLSFLFCSIYLVADVKSTSGTLRFDSDGDGSAEVVLNDTGLGIGITPSTNLEVSGNSIFTGTMAIGVENASSNLSVSGTISQSSSTLSDNTSSLLHSLNFLDTSSGNLRVDLPSPSTITGTTFTFKKTTHSNNVVIASSSGIDGYNRLVLESSTGITPTPPCFPRATPTWCSTP